MGGRKAITQEQYEEVSNTKPILWNGNDIPKNTGTKTSWKCKNCDYKWDATYNSIVSSGSGCPNCAGNAKRTIDDYDLIGINKGLLWNVKAGILSNRQLPKNAHTNTEWYCGMCDNIWETTYHIIQQGSGCPNCQRISESEYNAIADDRPIHWAGNSVPKTTSVKTEWSCDLCNHIWEATYSSIKQGRGCPNCRNTSLRLTIADYESVGANKNVSWNVKGTLFSSAKVPDNRSSITSWKCDKCNYEWQTSYNTIAQGTRCPSCAGLRPKTTEDYTNISYASTIFWNSNNIPKSVQHKTDWKCKVCEYEWQTTFDSISNGGTGCPKCANSGPSKGEQFIQKELDKENVGYCWQHKFDDFSNNRMSFDFYLYNQNIAIEVQGMHHYESVNWSGNMSKQELLDQFAGQLERDKLKVEYCRTNSIELWVFNTTERNWEKNARKLIKQLDYIK